MLTAALVLFIMSATLIVISLVLCVIYPPAETGFWAFGLLGMMGLILWAAVFLPVFLVWLVRKNVRRPHARFASSNKFPSRNAEVTSGAKSYSNCGQEIASNRTATLLENQKVVEYKYIGDLKNSVYHELKCTLVRLVDEKNMVWFSSTGEAQKEGFKRCKVCIERDDRISSETQD